MRLSDTKVLQFLDPAQPDAGGTVVLVDEATSTELVLDKAGVLGQAARLARFAMLSGSQRCLGDPAAGGIPLDVGEAQQALIAISQFAGPLGITMAELDDALTCVGCGCNDDRACDTGGGVPCHWVTPRMCSACLQVRL